MDDAAQTVLVVGGGGREHALLRAIAASPRCARALAAPGNPGMATLAQCHPQVRADAVEGLVELALHEGVSLVVIGPEVPLALGLADALRARGIAAYGPAREAAQLEASKAFAKAFMARHAIPTARSGTFTDLAQATSFIHQLPTPIVVKASGLAAGKGVVIAPTHAEAIETARTMLDGTAFGESGRTLVVEEFLHGEETSIHLIVSGMHALALPPSRDHKRIGEGDTGPNTGGMGAFAPSSLPADRLDPAIHQAVVAPTLAGLARDGLDYRGTLYIGLMMTADGPRVLEYNVRFGDPETQVLLPLLDGDWLPIFLAAARREPLPERFAWNGRSALTVVCASEGYPGGYVTGCPISIADGLPEGVWIDHAGTAREATGKIVTAGGRVLAVTATAPTLADARANAYAGVQLVDFQGKTFRRDLAPPTLHGHA